MIERRDLIMGKRGVWREGCLFVCLEHYNQKGVLNAVYLFIMSNSGVFRREKLELDRSNIYTKKKRLSFVVKKPISEKSSFFGYGPFLPTSRICLPTGKFANVVHNIVFSCFTIVTIDVGRGVRAM